MPEVPMKERMWILEELPSDQEAWNLMEQLPYNRAKREQLWRGRRWIVHLVAGSKRREEMKLPHCRGTYLGSDD